MLIGSLAILKIPIYHLVETTCKLHFPYSDVRLESFFPAKVFCDGRIACAPDDYPMEELQITHSFTEVHLKEMYE